MTRDHSYDIAVTGAAVMVPGSSSIRGWWRQLAAGHVSYTTVPPAQVVAAGGGQDDPNRIPVHGMLPTAELFDPDHFGMSMRAAELTDPQVRKLLEVSWQALEDAGHAPTRPGPVTAVFASTSGSPYLRRILMGSELDPRTLDRVLHGCEPDFVASTLAYRLGLTGPALAVQTACSSGLVALHLAIQSLLNGDSDQALVVAAGIDHPQSGYRYVPGGIWSPTGKCRPFSARADGVVAGSGAVGVVLRRIADAEAEELPIHGVIIGSAVNNDGAAKAGYFAPSPAGQEAVIRAALATAQTDASTLGYLETHGTGTAVGDPIEWAAASAAFSALGAGPGKIAIGAVKANIGHLDSAAGLAALVKVLLVIQEGVIPPVAGFEEPNPLLAVDGSPLTVPTVARAWESASPRRAAISAFGIGGTNAHVVLEQAPIRPRRTSPRHRPTLLVLSARDEDALATMESNLAEAVSDVAAPALEDVAFTLSEGRAIWSTRSAIVAVDNMQLAERMGSSPGWVRGTARSTPPDVVLLYPGQGGQQPGMARPLVQSLPNFARELDLCLKHFDDARATEIRTALLDSRFPSTRMSATAVAQPALFALGVAASAALRSVGVLPRAVIGHSLGELTAAAVAGAIPLVDACQLVDVRSQAMQDCEPGAMATLWCDEHRARTLIAQHARTVEVAAVNGPTITVVSGTSADVRTLLDAIPTNLPARRLAVDRAFHSMMVDPAQAAIARAVAQAHLEPCGVILGLTGSARVVMAGETVDANELVEQARRPVRFYETVAALAKTLPEAVGVEVGPGRTLSALASPHLPVEPLLRDGTLTEADSVVQSLGALWVRGIAIDPTQLGADGRRVHLPTYPFTGRRVVAAEAECFPSAHTRSIHHLDASCARTSASAEALPDHRTAIVALWSQLLGADSFLDNADFLDMGGDSLLVAELGSRITHQFGIAVPLRELMAARTLGGHVDVLRRHVDRAANAQGVQ